ncbi:hypothetical protein IWQ62_006389, partial [Dispira parvispora]
PNAGGAHHSHMYSRSASLSQAESMYTPEPSSQPPYMPHMMTHQHPPAPGFSGPMDAVTNGGHPQAPHPPPSLGGYQQHPLAPSYSTPSGPMVGGSTTITNPMYHPPPHSFQGAPPPHHNGSLPHHPSFPPNMTPHPPPPTGIQRYGYPMPPTAGPMYGSYGMVHHPHHHPYAPPPMGAVTGPPENSPGYHHPPNNSVPYVGPSSSGTEQTHANVPESTVTSNP